MALGNFQKIQIGNNPIQKLYKGTSLLWQTGDVGDVTPPSVASDLMLWYDFNEGTGDTFTDKSTRNRHATFTNPQWTTGGAVFLGTGYGQLPATAFPNTLYGFTVAIRFKLSALSNSSILSMGTFGQPGKMFDIAIKQNGTMDVTVMGTAHIYTSLANALVADNTTWYELVVKGNSGRISFYLNGVELFDKSYEASPLMTNTAALVIGGLDQQTSGFFQGTIDELRFFNDARHASTFPTIFTADPTIPYVERAPKYLEQYYGTDVWGISYWNADYGIWPGGSDTEYAATSMHTFGDEPDTTTGSEMRITGEGFDGLTGVTLNGNSLPFTLLSRESVSVSVLNQRSGYFVLYTKEGPITATFRTSLLYQPTLTTISHTEIFLGDMVTFTGQYFSELTQVRSVRVGSTMDDLAGEPLRHTKFTIRSKTDTQMTCEVTQVGTSGAGAQCTLHFEDSSSFYGRLVEPLPYPTVAIWEGALTISDVSPATMLTYDPLTITGSGFTNAGTLTFKIGGVDMSGSTVIVDSATQLRLFPNKAASGTVQLTSTIKKGTTSTGSVTVTITPPATLVPASDVVVNAWTTAPLWSKLSDLTDTTFIDSGFTGPLCTLRINTGNVAGKKPLTAELRIRMAKAGNQNNQSPMIQVHSLDGSTHYLNHGTTTVSATTYTEYIIPFTATTLTVPTAYNLHITAEQQKGNSSRFSSLRVARAEIRLTF
jgi:hypothetical protein